MEFEIDYKGFDLNPIWTPIHNKINELIDCNSSFFIKDVFDYYSKADDFPNILVLNYVLSDILRTKPDEFNVFIYNLVELYNKMSSSALIINDINLGKNSKQVRWHFDSLIERLKRENDLQDITKYHFANSQRQFFPYGTLHTDNNSLVTPPTEIENKYSPWLECRSAQVIIWKTKKHDIKC